MAEMNREQKQRLFDIKCRSKVGKAITRAEQRFCERMYKLYPEEYADDERKVFEATKPFGA